MCLAAATLLSAAESTRRIPVLGVSDLIRMAINASPELGEIKGEVASAKSDLAQAQAGYYPQLDTVGTVGPVTNARRPAVSGTRIIDPTRNDDIGIFGRIDVTLTQPLYTFGKLSSSKEAAQRGMAASELKLGQKRNEIAVRVKELYYALVLARAGMAAADEAAGYFDEARHRMERLLEAGSENVVESDLYRVDAYRADIVRGRAEAEKGMRVAYFALKALTGMPPDTDFEPAEKSLPFDEEGLKEQDAYVQSALDQRFELRQLDQALAAQKSLVAATRSDLYPTFFTAFAGSLAGAPGRQTFHNPYIRDDFNHVEAGIVGGAKWHFDFGITRARIDKERAQYDRLAHTNARARLNIPIEVAKTYQDVRQWRTAVRAYRSAVLASRKWIVAALSSFDMGTGTADDMLRGIERYGLNQGKFLEAVFNYNMSLARLEYVAGVKNW
jgi:outer membrane protein TolC